MCSFQITISIAKEAIVIITEGIRKIDGLQRNIEWFLVFASENKNVNSPKFDHHRHTQLKKKRYVVRYVYKEAFLPLKMYKCKSYRELC